jgi:hypothetical protein
MQWTCIRATCSFAVAIGVFARRPATTTLLNRASNVAARIARHRLGRRGVRIDHDAFAFQASAD